MSSMSNEALKEGGLLQTLTDGVEDVFDKGVEAAKSIANPVFKTTFPELNQRIKDVILTNGNKTSPESNELTELNELHLRQGDLSRNDNVLTDVEKKRYDDLKDKYINPDSGQEAGPSGGNRRNRRRSQRQRQSQRQYGGSKGRRSRSRSGSRRRRNRKSRKGGRK